MTTECDQALHHSLPSTELLGSCSGQLSQVCQSRVHFMVQVQVVRCTSNYGVLALLLLLLLLLLLVLVGNALTSSIHCYHDYYFYLARRKHFEG